MAVIHYNPRPGNCDEDVCEVAPCGTFVGDNSGYSGDWLRVTCKKCLKMKKRSEGGER